MQVEDDKKCFVCGSDNPYGLHVQFEVDDVKHCARSEYKIPSRFQGWHNITHGGILATLLDEVSIYACRGMAEQVVTAGINVRYKKPVQVETDLVLSAEVVEKKKRFFFIKARIEVDGVVHVEAETKVFSC